MRLSVRYGLRPDTHLSRHGVVVMFDFDLPSDLSRHLMELGLVPSRKVISPHQDEIDQVPARDFRGEWYRTPEEVPF